VVRIHVLYSGGRRFGPQLVDQLCWVPSAPCC
jgi:hypothetical protein